MLPLHLIIGLNIREGISWYILMIVEFWFSFFGSLPNHIVVGSIENHVWNFYFKDILILFFAQVSKIICFSFNFAFVRKVCSNSVHIYLELQLSWMITTVLWPHSVTQVLALMNSQGKSWIWQQMSFLRRRLLLTRVSLRCSFPVIGM